MEGSTEQKAAVQGPPAAPDPEKLIERDLQEFKDLHFKRSLLGENLATLELQRADIVRRLENNQISQTRLKERIQKKLGIKDFKVNLEDGKIKELKDLGPMPEDK